MKLHSGVKTTVFLLSVSLLMSCSRLEETRHHFESGIKNTKPLVANDSFKESTEVTDTSVIAQLRERQNAVLANSGMRSVANGVINQNQFASRSALKVAKHEQLATKNNWMPKISPTLSLTGIGISFGGAMTKTFFNKAGRQAELEMAKANVDLAFVTLALDMNDKVSAVLLKYVDLWSARQQVDVYVNAIQNLAKLKSIMLTRNSLGIDRPNELNSVNSTIVMLTEKLTDHQYQTSSLEDEIALESGVNVNVSTVSVSAIMTNIETCEKNTSLDEIKAKAIFALNQSRLAMAQADLQPSLEAYAGLGTSGGIGPGIKLDNWTYQLGGKHRELVLKGRAKAFQSVYENALNESTRMLKSMKSKKGALEESVRSSYSISINMKQDRRLAERQFQVGTGTATNLAKSIEFEARAEGNVIVGIADQIKASIVLCKHFGMLVDGREVVDQNIEK